MAEMTIKLKCDPVTGKKDIIISLSGESDALPHEHEQQHKALVDKLIEGGIVQASEVGKIVVEREEEVAQPATPASNPEQSERQAQAEGELEAA